MRFQYEQEEVGGVSVVTIPNTGGVFHGHSLEQVSKIAEGLYPNYQSNDLSNTFSDVYFNYCLRKLLSGQDIPNTYTPKNFKLLNLNQFSNLDE